MPVPADTAPPFFPLVRSYWPSQQRSPAKARGAGLPATPLRVTAADVLAWDRQRGGPPLDTGFSPSRSRRRWPAAVTRCPATDQPGAGTGG